MCMFVYRCNVHWDVTQQFHKSTCIVLYACLRSHICCTHITHVLHNFWFAVVKNCSTMMITLIVFIQGVWTPVQGRQRLDRRDTRGQGIPRPIQGILWRGFFERRRMERYCPRSPGWAAGCKVRRRRRWRWASHCCCTSCRRGWPPACPRPPCRRGRGSWRASPPRSPPAPAAAGCLNYLPLLILRRSCFLSRFQQVDELQVHGKPELGEGRLIAFWSTSQFPSHHIVIVSS